jgi:GH24 family phage-related lysozyme (muramidase)
MKTYKFWNSELIGDRIPIEKLDSYTCTAAQLTAVEDECEYNMSTLIKLNDDEQAAAVASMVFNEGSKFGQEIRYEEIKEDV